MEENNKIVREDDETTPSPAENVQEDTPAQEVAAKEPEPPEMTSSLSSVDQAFKAAW